MSAKDVSIIIPVYNVEAYIGECIRSVMDQTFDGVLECIIVDDCGSDCSMDIAAQMVAAYDGPIQFNILHHDHNRGLSASRNTGIRAAIGDYIYFLDSDDYITFDCIAILAAKAIQYPDVDLVQGSTITSIKHSTTRWMDLTSKDLPDYTADRSWIKKAYLTWQLSRTAINKLIKRSFVLKNNLFFKEGIIHEDEHWSFFLSKVLTRISIVSSQNTYVYRIRPYSITDSGNALRNEGAMLIVSEDCINNIDTNCKSDQLRYIFPTVLKILVHSPEQSHRVKARVLLKKLMRKAGIGGCGVLLLTFITICYEKCRNRLFRS